MLHLRRYLSALAVALAAYGCYAVLAAPWLEPAAPARAEGSRNHDSLGPVGIDAELEGLFEVGSWERDDPKIVETAQCTLLLKDYQPLPDGRIEIKPCTLIFFTAPTSPTGGSSRRPIVLRAPAGAVLQFDRPIDVGRATVGRLMEGTLRGQIRIYSPPSRPGAKDRLELTARNVKIDREKVYTPSVVQFRYGASFGHGRDLTITLLPEDKDHPQRSPSIGALSVLQLAKVERLHLEGASASMLPAPTGSSGPPADSANLRQELPLEVRCDGPLVVDFEQNVAALDENVEISRVYPQGVPDRLKCDRLIFHLAERTVVAKVKSPALPAAAGGVNARQIIEQVERVIALGSPVVLDAPQSGIFAKATRVEYATNSKRIALESGPAAPQVSLKYGQSEFEAGEIEYEMAEPGRIGRLWAAGPGRLKFVPDGGSQREPIEATWQDSLTIAPHEKNKLVSLKGRPIVSLGQASSFAVRQVHDGKRLHPGKVYLWLSEVPRQDAQPVDAGTDKRTPRYAILPDRLLAIGQVEVDSPQLAAHTRELRTWFVHQAAAAAPSPAPPGVARFDPSPRDPAENPADGSPRLQKLDVAGSLVQLQVIRRGDESAVEQLEIKGDVHVTERIAAGPSAVAPLELTGHSVTLRHGTSENAKLEIHGQPAAEGRAAEPAKVSARGISLSGAMIHLRRADNRLWIPGRGEAILPMPMEEPSSGILAPPEAGRPLGTDADATNEPLPSATRPLKVTWRDAFEFDGQKGVFSGAIEARGQSEFAAGEELNFTLNQRIDFAAPRPQGGAEIARLEILGGMEDVTMQRVLYDEQQQVSAVDNARVRNLVIDRTTGKFHASGPGEVWTVRRDLGTIAGGGLVPMPMAAGAAKKLSYVCVTFQGQIEGDLGRRQIEFQRQVDTIYGQVESWNERVVATRAEDLGESGVHMQSDTLAITEMAFSPTDKWMEMDARGNTLAEGMRFIARAAQISYHSGKDVLSIKGDGRVLAEFWHRAAPGAQPSYVEAGHFIFHRATGSLEMGDAKSIDLSDLPLGGKPAPRLR